MREKTFNLLLLSIFIIFAFAWSLKLNYMWDYDYGLWYTSSIYFDKEYTLYKNEFDNKGPFYFFFIKSLSYLIGKGPFQAYITLSITISFFFISVFLIIKNSSIQKKIIIVLLTTCLLWKQSTNASLWIFHSTILLLYFHFLMEFVVKKKFNLLFISFIFFILSIFTKIDSLAFFPIVLFSAIYFIYNSKSKRIDFFKTTFVFVSLIIIIYFFFQTYFGYTLNDYMIHNFDYSFQTRTEDSIERFFFRPLSISMLLTSGILIIFIDISNESFKKLNNFKEFLDPKIFFPITIVIFGLGIFIFVGKDLYRYLWIIYPCILFFIIYNINLFKITKTKFIFYFLILFYIVLLNISPPVFKNFISNNCFKNIYCKGSIANLFKETVFELKKSKFDKVFILGGRGWVYLLSEKKPYKIINNNVLYAPIRKKIFETDGMLKPHQNFLKQNEQKFFYAIWDIYVILNKEEKKYSPHLLEVKKKSKVISRNQNYFKLSINK